MDRWAQVGDLTGPGRKNSGIRVSGAWARGVVNSFRALGLDVEALCKEVGTSIDIFMDTNHRPPRDALGGFWRAALVQSGDRHLGLSAAEAWEPRADHLVVLLLTSAETVGEGLEASLRYQELLSHGRVVTLGEHPEYHVLHINKIEHELPITAHEIEFIAVFAMKLLRFATDGAFKAREVHFEHPYRGNIQKYTHAFGCSVLFGKEKTAIFADDEAWALPHAHGNQALHGQLRGVAAGLHATIEAHPFIDTVRDNIKLLLPRGKSSIEAVASSLHMTPRTLQRRLQEDGTSFRVLMDAVRKSILLEGFERNQTPDEVMRYAGYTNPRSFRRALKRWDLADVDDELAP
ncbi:MAG: AraC family transcriptional regulator ligand-binding domain-containing protein [Deltaproteobacteria bacterium]